MDRPTFINSAGSPCKTTIQVSSGNSNSATKETKLISDSSDYKLFSTGRVTMVDTKSETLQWKKYNAAPFMCSYTKRYIQERLGCSLQWSKDRGIWSQK